jgi:copper ion binding protein
MKKLSIILMLAMIVAACGNSTSSEKKASPDKQSAVEVAIIDISGMHCESCVNTITGVLTEIEGVGDVKVALEYEQAKIKFDPEEVTTDELKEAIEEKGYEVTNIELKSVQKKKVEATE